MPRLEPKELLNLADNHNRWDDFICQN